MRCGLQVNTHAIGDAANRVVLDAYAAAIAATGGGPGRHRIEHAQVLAPADIERFATLGVIASVQPTHATSDMPWAETRLGADRVRGAYAWRRLVDAGARLALGSDFPVERVSPILGFYAAVTRQDAAGVPAGGWYGQPDAHARRGPARLHAGRRLRRLHGARRRQPRRRQARRLCDPLAGSDDGPARADPRDARRARPTSTACPLPRGAVRRTNAARPHVVWPCRGRAAGYLGRVPHPTRR